MGSSKAAKPVRCKKKASIQSAVDSPAPERARYVVPGDDFEDADFVRAQQISGSAAFGAHPHLGCSICQNASTPFSLAAWAQSGLFSDDPNVVLDRLPGNDNKKKRQSMRLLLAMTRQIRTWQMT
jgi:hypothetical protein